MKQSKGGENLKKQLGYKVDASLKKDYEEMIIAKNGSKKFHCSQHIEKLMKLELALQGNDSYKNDPEVKALFHSLAENEMITHTLKKNNNGSMDLFADVFKQTFTPGSIVPIPAIKQLAIREQGVVSDRAVQNRVNYVIGLGLAEYTNSGKELFIPQKEESMDF
jgi:hypothetical protein